MNLYSRLRGGARDEKRSWPNISLEEYLSYLTFGGATYGVGAGTTYGRNEVEEIETDFCGLVRGAYKSNGVVFACELARFSLFSEATFKFQRYREGRPGQLWGNEKLRPLERPWPGVSTDSFLKRMILDADFAGNSYHVHRPRGLKRLRPDWMTVLLGSEEDVDSDGWDVDAEVIGYLYHPGGRHSGRDPVPFLPREVAHFAPTPDPEASYRGMSWLTPVVLEILGDKAATQHKIKFFENGATPNLAVKLDVANPDEFRKWVDLFAEKYEGVENAYKTLMLGAGADYTVIGADMRQLDFKVTQGAGETRIAAASGVGPVIVGLSEGLQGSSLNAGNYGAARRRFADGTMRPLWRAACSALAPLIDVPSDSRLWYDDRDVSFLQEDVRDGAEILERKAQAIRTLVDGGYTPESAVAAVEANDLSLLKHSGLLSVQLQQPGTATPAVPIPS